MKPKTAFARHLRTCQTDAEQRVWQQLRAHRLAGLKFRRQQPVGPYVVDFFCAERRLIVELDGGQHQDRAAYDTERDAWLKRAGYTVLRYWNNEVMTNLQAVLEDVMKQAGVGAQASPSPPTPPPSGERGDSTCESAESPHLRGGEEGETRADHSPQDPDTAA